MSVTSSATPAQPSTTPESHFPKQAIVVIHGIGEQRPMDTITDFVRAVWETDPDVCRNGKPLPAETWSKPDVRTGSLELRRITTRESTPTPAFPRGARSDFYELYWADLSAGSTWDEVRAWVAGLLCRNPFTSVPRDVMLAWIALWVLCLVDPCLARRKRAAEGRHDLSNSIPQLLAILFSASVADMGADRSCCLSGLARAQRRGSLCGTRGALYAGDAGQHRRAQGHSGTRARAARRIAQERLSAHHRRRPQPRFDPGL